MFSRMVSSLSVFFVSIVWMLGTTSLHAANVSFEPDDYLLGADLRNAVPGVILSVEGEPGTIVISDFFEETNPAWPTVPFNFATTGILVFGQDPSVGPLGGQPVWDQDNHGMLRADFAHPTNFVQIDVAFGDDDIGILQAFSYSGILLDEVIGSGDGRAADPSDRFFQPSILRAQNDIAYILAGGKDAEALFLDNLQFNRVVPLPAAFPLFLTALGAMGLIGWRRRRAAVAVNSAG